MDDCVDLYIENREIHKSIGRKNVLSFVVDFLDGSQPVVQAAQLKKRRAQELSDTVDMRCGGFVHVKGSSCSKSTNWLQFESSEQWIWCRIPRILFCEREGYIWAMSPHSRPKCVKNLRQTGRRRLLRGSPVWSTALQLRSPPKILGQKGGG